MLDFAIGENIGPVETKAGWVHQKGEPLILGLSSLEDKQGDYRGNQNQECNELGETHVAP